MGPSIAHRFLDKIASVELARPPDVLFVAFTIVIRPGSDKVMQTFESASRKVIAQITRTYPESTEIPR